MKYSLKILLSLLIISTSLIASVGNQKIKSFSKSKKILETKIYNEKKLKFDHYTGCSFESKKVWNKKKTKKMKKLVINHKECGFIARTPKSGEFSNRSRFIEWEHLIPAENFGRSFKSWRDGHPKCVVKSGKKKGEKYKGRKCATKVSKEFKMMEADIFNLVPANGQINGDRSNFTFTELAGEPRIYGSNIDFEVDFKARKAEPNNEMKGQIARTYLYFYKIYNMKLSSKQKKLYNAWNKMYPITELERYIISKKEKIQKNKFEY